MSRLKPTPIGRRTTPKPTPARPQPASPAERGSSSAAEARPKLVLFRGRDTEHREQAHLFDRARLSLARYPELEDLYAIPNQGQRSKRARGRMLAEGLKAGMPDTHLPHAREGWIGERRVVFHSLYLEMKAEGHVPHPEKPGAVLLEAGTCSRAQKERIARLLAAGNAVDVCWNAEDAWATLTAYLEGRYRQRPEPWSRRTRA
jgi:hypothetical protein